MPEEHPRKQKCHLMRSNDLGSNGNLKPFEQWKKEVMPIASHQVGNWLRTEYDTAVLRARQAAVRAGEGHPAQPALDALQLPARGIRRRGLHPWPKAGGSLPARRTPPATAARCLPGEPTCSAPSSTCHLFVHHVVRFCCPSKVRVFMCLWGIKEMRAASQRPAFFSFLGISFV